MVEGRLVGLQFTGFGLVEDGGTDKTDLEHEVMLKDEKLRREEREVIKKLHFYVSGAKVQIRILCFFGIIRSKIKIIIIKITFLHI